MKEKYEIIQDLKALIGYQTNLDKTLPHQIDPRWQQQFWQQLFTSSMQSREELLSQIAAEVQLPHSARLGLYIEQLWLAIIQHHPAYQTISHNTQVIEQGRTLGAFDFLLLHKPSQQFEHWELTFKFYLAVQPEPTKPAVWLGPNLNDDWPSKRNKLIDKQICLSEQAAAQRFLRQLGINQINERRILASGVIFQPCNAAKAGNAADLCWYSQAQWQLLSNSLNWYPQDKLDWLAPKPTSTLFSNPASPLAKPVFVAGFEANSQHATKRCFVVPDDWPKNAHKKAAAIAAADKNEAID